MSKPKAITITPEQQAALRALAAAFAPPTAQDQKIIDALESPTKSASNGLTVDKLQRAKRMLDAAPCKSTMMVDKDGIREIAPKRNTNPKATRKEKPATQGPTEPEISSPAIGEGKRKVSKRNARSFWTDGANAYLRRKKANPAMIERVDEKVRKGEYRHKATSDDVEVYTIAEWSPLRRRQLNLSECSPLKLEGYIVRAACRHDYKLYYDAVSEYAYRIKNSTSDGKTIPPGTAELILQNSMAYIERRIMNRGGPSSIMISQELAKIRKERSGTRLYLPH